LCEDNDDEDRSGSQAYQFHTNILGVNHTIRKEAEELLYKRNIFVVLSYEYFRLGIEHGGLFWLPIVSKNHGPKMKKHSVRIRVSPGSAGHRGAGFKGNTSMQSVIFLARDLDVFCLIMATAGASCTQTNLTVLLSKNGAGGAMLGFPEASNIPNLAAPQFECELRNTEYRQFDGATQRQMLAPMARILAPSQRVSFRGVVCDFQEVDRMKEVMSPTLNCLPASKWALFEALSLAKDVADAAFPHDDPKFVMTLYHTIALTLAESTCLSEDRSSQRQELVIACPEAVEACGILALEAWVSAACCAVKARDEEALGEVSLYIQESMERRAEEYRTWKNTPPQLEGLCYSVMMWAQLYVIEGDLPTIREVVQYLTGCGRNPHLVHDSEILLRQPDQEAVLTPEHLPFDQCSALQLPLPSMSYHKTLLKPRRFDG